MVDSQIRFAAIGECMIELAHSGPDSLRLGYGGDTLNTATYLMRYGAAAGVSVDYVTALGDDPYSEEMLSRWRAEGIGTELVARIAGRLPGLYLIRTDAGGERSFYYFRGAAAAREMFHTPQAPKLLKALTRFEMLYLSGITLSILDPVSRRALVAALDEARANGARVVFDSNYRPRAWPSRKAAARVIGAFLERVDIALPSLEDHRGLFGDRDATACAARLRALGIGEVAVKDGAGPCLISSAESQAWVPAQAGVRPLDTSAAGDSFNAAYLAARLAGADPEAAARCGHGLAATVIRHQGAVIPLEAMPPFQPR